MNIQTIQNIKYNTTRCSECKEVLTKRDKYRDNRKVYRIGVEDCEACEVKQIETNKYENNK